MSGHSKWSKIKRSKGVADINRGQVFTKLAREIIVAVKEGGPNPEANFRLRLAIQKARDNNMPLDNIDRAIRRGSGSIEGASMVEMTLEGFGPGGSAIMVKAVSDNRNRTLQDIRNVFNRHGGNLGEAGSVAWLFDFKGIITAKAEGLTLEDLELKAIDAGAEDVRADSGQVEIYTRPNELEQVRTTLNASKVPIVSSELSLIPKTLVELDEKAAIQALKLMNKLEELDEVQSVSINANFPDEIIEKYHAEVQA